MSTLCISYYFYYKLQLVGLILEAETKMQKNPFKSWKMHSKVDLVPAVMHDIDASNVTFGKDCEE